MPDYIPRPDGDFSAFADNFKKAAHVFWTMAALDPNDLKPLDMALLTWQANYPAHVAALAAAEGARQTKDTARRALEAAIRPIAAFVQSYPKTTDGDRASMGITVRAGVASRETRVASRPLVTVEGGERLTHVLKLVDESTPTRRRKPRGASRAEVYVALGDPQAPAPGDPGVYRYLGSATDGEIKLSFPAGEGGKQAHYLARWISTSGQAGPWSETASATVAV